MNFNVYLPDDIGERAKEEDLKLSRMLRDAVTEEFKRRDAMTAALNEKTTYEVDVIVDGYPVTGRITGTLIVDDGEWELYLTEDRRVLLVGGQTYTHFNDPEHDLYDFFVGGREPDEREMEPYIQACQALGFRPVIEL
jgi:hypothetical protein